MSICAPICGSTSRMVPGVMPIQSLCQLDQLVPLQSMDLKPYPRVQAYMERCKARPAYKETVGKSMG